MVLEVSAVEFNCAKITISVVSGPSGRTELEKPDYVDDQKYILLSPRAILTPISDRWAATDPDDDEAEKGSTQNIFSKYKRVKVA